MRPMNKDGLPTVTADQMRRVDELAVGQYHLELIQMMENAGRCLAELARSRFLKKAISGHKVLILAGAGGNGGGGLVAARRLQNWGANTTTMLATSPENLAEVPSHQLKVLRKTGATVLGPNDNWEIDPDLIIDALLGYSQRGAPRPPIDRIIEMANRSPAPRLALDVPTGLNPDSGQPLPPTIQASATLTLALPKTGLTKLAAQGYVGELWLADISIPPDLYRELNLAVPLDLFAMSDLIQL